ncbi:plasmid mobilization protein [Alkalinema pantanalense CENA528]|uniref:plasmid mobilization protein n=1 Tax=Alkalinema pantanalense TaxID=1620705 RepID=UPI003D6DD23B
MAKRKTPQEPCLSIRFTPSERERIDKAAKAKGISRHAYMRQKLLRDLSVGSAA